MTVSNWVKRRIGRVRDVATSVKHFYPNNVLRSYVTLEFDDYSKGVTQYVMMDMDEVEYLHYRLGKALNKYKGADIPLHQCTNVHYIADTLAGKN